MKPSSSVKETLKMMKAEEDDEVRCKGVSAPKMVKKKEAEDAEIGVFGAEKYFNGDMDSDTSPRLPLSLPIIPQPYSLPKTDRSAILDPKPMAKSSAGTASVRSETSWNSQSLLLQTKYGKTSKSSTALQRKKPNPTASKKSFLASMRCNCACNDGNSVDIEENIYSDPGFLAQETASRRAAMKIEKEEDEVIQRKSLEVFGSPILEKRSVQKKLTVLPWEPTSSTRSEEQQRGFSVKYSEEDESGSDASSDLFEIESLTRKPKSLLARQESDPSSPTCYAPSEASIEWSVVTASAADFSVMSECATSPVRNRSIPIPRNPNPKSIRETAQRRKSSSGLLLGCKSHKSVRVSGDSYRAMNRPPSYVPSFATGTRRMSESSVSHSQSPRIASHLLYIQ